MSRQEDWERISEMAGVDEDGSILPPSNVGGIDRAPLSFWFSKGAVDCHFEQNCKITLDNFRAGRPLYEGRIAPTTIPDLK